MLSGCLQIGAALLMVGLAAWSRGWLCCKHMRMQRSSSEPLDVGAMPSAVAATAMSQDDLACSLPELGVQLTSFTKRRKSVDAV